MDAHRQPRDIGDEDNPTVTRSCACIHHGLAIGLPVFVPFQDEPEHQGGEKAGEGIDLGLHSRKPKGVAEGVGKGSHRATCLDADGLCDGCHVSLLADDSSGKMGDGEEKEEDASGTQQRRHEVDHLGHLRGVAGQMCEEVGHQHEYRSSRRMTNLQFVAAGDEFRTIPETGRGLYGQTINNGGNGEGQPCRGGVDFLESSSLHHILPVFSGKVSNYDAKETKIKSDICLTFMSQTNVSLLCS